MSEESLSPEHRRMVIFVGPHKSALSSVEQFFVDHAAYGKKNSPHHPSLQQWAWPWIPKNPKISHHARKGFAPLVIQSGDGVQFILDIMLKTWNATNPNTGDHLHLHMIWGSEELDRFGPTPWTHRNGLDTVKQVYELIRPTQLDMVVNYRRPRQEHWISVWKQIRFKNQAYDDFMCNSKKYLELWEYLDCTTNPLRLVEVFLDFWDQLQQKIDGSDTMIKPTSVSVHLLDMEGIARLDRDAGHVLACDVLGVECTKNHWLPNVERPVVQNHKSGNSGLTEVQLDEMDWLLRQRDCLYRPRLDQAANRTKRERTSFKVAPLYLHYADTIWDGCPDEDYDDSFSLMFSNTTYLLDLLQSQVGCGSLSKDAISDLRERRQRTQDGVYLKSTSQKTLGSTFRQDSAHHGLLLNSTTATSYPEKQPPGMQAPGNRGNLMKRLETQLLLQYMLIVMLIAALFKLSKCQLCKSVQIQWK